MKHFQLVILLPEHTDNFMLPDDGVFPNNQLLPVLIYRHAFQISGEKAEDEIKDCLSDHGWKNAWVAGVYDYHHYHSTAHEVLVALSGEARLQLGGPSGREVNFTQGDVLILPSGTAHRCIHATGDFRCMGAYPDGQNYDILTGKSDERPAADQRIAKVPLPASDPVYRTDGPLVFHWTIESVQV
jgi:uncharacterized protein YjlB